MNYENFIYFTDHGQPSVSTNNELLVIRLLRRHWRLNLPSQHHVSCRLIHDRCKSNFLRRRNERNSPSCFQYCSGRIDVLFIKQRYTIYNWLFLFIFGINLQCFTLHAEYLNIWHHRYYFYSRLLICSLVWEF